MAVPALPARDQRVRAADRVRRRPALSGSEAVDADTFVLTLPMARQQQALALLVFIGGLSAATGMVIVETIALSTMVCNDLVMPVLLRMQSLRLAERPDLSWLLLAIRRGAIVAVMLLGYLYFRLAGEAYALVSIGLISFAAVAQFAPAILGGIYWKWRDARRRAGGARRGLCRSGSTRCCCRPSPSRAGCPSASCATGPFGIALLKPHEFFGLTGLDEITHAMFWSMVANIGAYVAVSVLTRPGVAEQAQAALFVDIFKHGDDGLGVHFWKGSASMPDLNALLARFLGPGRARLRGCRVYAALRPAFAKRTGRRRGFRAVRGDRARRRDRRRLGPDHGRRDGQGGGAVDRRGLLDAGRGLTGHRLQPPARAQVARARGGDRGAHRGERAVAGTRPHEGRLRVDGDPRAAHTADVDSRVLRDPARQSGPRSRGAGPLPRHHPQGERATHPAHQSGPRPGQARLRARRVDGRRARSQGGDRRGDHRDQPALSRKERRARHPLRWRRPASRGRPRPSDAGGDQPAVERGQVRRRRERTGDRVAHRRCRRTQGRRRRQRSGHRAARTARRYSRSSARPATR